MNARLLILVVLGAALLASAVSLVYVQHLRRTLVVELKALQAQRGQLEVEWGQLQLEASTWAAQDRVERLATDKLSLRVPRPEDVVLVDPSRESSNGQPSGAPGAVQ